MNKESFAQHQCTLQGVFQLTHIARPVVLQKHLTGLISEQVIAIVLRGVLANKASGQGQNVLSALTQRGDVQRQHIKAKHQIGTEPARGHLAAKIAVGGSNNAHVQGNFLLPAESFDALFLEHTQQFGLQAQWQLTDFIQQ